MEEKIFLTVKQLSQKIGIPAYSLRKYAREGRLPAYKLDGRNYLFKLAEVIEIIQNNKV